MLPQDRRTLRVARGTEGHRDGGSGRQANMGVLGYGSRERDEMAKSASEKKHTKSSDDGRTKNLRTRRTRIRAAAGMGVNDKKRKAEAEHQDDTERQHGQGQRQCPESNTGLKRVFPLCWLHT